MRYLCLSHRLPGAEAAEIAALLRDEARAVWDLYAEGIAREAHLDRRAGKGVLMLECADDDAVMRALARLPLVARGLIGFDIHPLSPFANLALLFAEPTTKSREENQ